MKISKLFPGLFLPFLIFATIGAFCPSDIIDEEDCGWYPSETKQLYTLNKNSLKIIELKTHWAEAKCKARFYVVFGWEDPTMFASKSEKSPMDNNFAGLKVKFGDTAWNTTFSYTPIQRAGKSPYDGSSGYVWVIDIPVSASPVSNISLTMFYVEIQHSIFDEDHNFFVEATIGYTGID